MLGDNTARAPGFAQTRHADVTQWQCAALPRRECRSDSGRPLRDVAQLGSAPAWGAGGRRFNSCHPDVKQRRKWSKNKNCTRHDPNTGTAVRKQCRYRWCDDFHCPFCGGIWFSVGAVGCKCVWKGKTRRQYIYPDMAPAPVLGVKSSKRR